MMQKNHWNSCFIHAFLSVTFMPKRKSHSNTFTATTYWYSIAIAPCRVRRLRPMHLFLSVQSRLSSKQLHLFLNPYKPITYAHIADPDQTPQNVLSGSPLSAYITFLKMQILMKNIIQQSKKSGKDQESIKSSTTPDPGCLMGK